MKRLLLLFLAATLAVTAHAAPSGNDFYAAGKYAEAASAYEAQVKQGEYSANLFFNLANADFRLGKRGPAILNYRRALLLEPAHAEASANLAFVRGTASPDPSSGSSTPWAWAAAAAAWVALAALVAGALSRTKRLATWTLATVALLAFAGCVAAIRYWTNDAETASAAIVLEDKTRALYAPADSAALVTNLPAGDEVQVLADRGAWLYAQLPNGARAWLSSAKVERLIPGAP